jgi:hypothetical protein
MCSGNKEFFLETLMNKSSALVVDCIGSSRTSSAVSTVTEGPFCAMEGCVQGRVLVMLLAAQNVLSKKGNPDDYVR